MTSPFSSSSLSSSDYHQMSSREAEETEEVSSDRRRLSPPEAAAHLRHYHRRLPFHLWVSVLVLCPLFFLLLLANSTALPGLSVLRLRMDPDHPAANVPQIPLRVMSFNIWVSGANVNDGMAKIAKHIREVDPDIVALQEVRTAEVAKNLTELLGPSKWKCMHHPYASYPDTAILTKHSFVLEDEFVHLQFERNISDFLFNEEHYKNHSVVTYGMIRKKGEKGIRERNMIFQGATIQLEPSGQRVNFFSLHLEWRSYGPYAANNKMVTSAKQIMEGERNKQGYGRAQNIEQLLANEGFKQAVKVADKQPLIVAGDFNAPSHLDWTEETKDIHGGWAFEWPSTKLLMDAGLNDSFRHIHPDVIKEPGITWSTVQKDVGPDWDWMIPEPQDRIDFVMYKPSQRFRPTNSFTYAGNEPLKPIPEQLNNDWPSDHYAVVTEFTIDGEELSEDAYRN